MKTAISYIRWSSGRQSHGESLERQLSKTKEFCATHGLTLDEELVDVAKSAFKSKHTQKGGKLAKFLEDLENGLVPKGVTLIVESLDRLSRATVPVALRQFLQIIEHDVDIVTLIDGSWYSRKSLGDDSTPLLMSLVYMMRAHDESKNKAYRLLLAISISPKAAISSPEKRLPLGRNFPTFPPPMLSSAPMLVLQKMDIPSSRQTRIWA
jgi:DNA invertase Pin-like site-specific DNA recombinase